MTLTQQHREILQGIGVNGATETELIRQHLSGREFDDLRYAGLVVFWPTYGSRPENAFGGSHPGSWLLTSAGLSAIELQPNLRLA